MKTLDLKDVPTLPDDIDFQCVGLCNVLNSLPTVETMESCCGHCNNVFSIWFSCDSIDVLTRLGRAVERNYSDGKWEVVVDSCDTRPYGLFWLRTKEPFNDYDEMQESVSSMEGNILYWFKDEFDEYFSKK